MRVWDINPGYLNKDSLLGEHREIHALLAILGEGKRGYAHHPETRRWRGHEEALALRHRLVASEMSLRGWVDRTPVSLPADRPAGGGDVQSGLRSGCSESPAWPDAFLDAPAHQLRLLESRYLEWDRGFGRIPFPRNAQQLWAQHKYSVLARSQEEYLRVGRAVSRPGGVGRVDALAEELVLLLRTAASPGGVRNAAAHVWGYVAGHAADGAGRRVRLLLETDPLQVLSLTYRLAVENQVSYLIHSTAFSDLPAQVAGGLSSGTGGQAATRRAGG